MAPQLINRKINMKKVNIQKYNKIKTISIKSLLKKISNLWATILLMKLDLFITMVKKNQKEFMEMRLRKILKNLEKKG